MDFSRKTIELEKQLVEIENLLLTPPTVIDELVALLDRVWHLLEDIEQLPPRSLQDALVPSMKALVADELLRHPDNDVRVSVASCISEIIRISAPDPPYDDEHMREIFQLFVATLENLCHVSGRYHKKAISILETIERTSACLIMLDLECDAVIVEMFRHFLKITGLKHSELTYIKSIMVLTIDKSDNVSWDLLSTLLDSVRKGSQDVSPTSWDLGENVFTNCAAKLKPYLLEAVQSRGIDVDEYAEIVAYICKGECKTLQHDHLNRTEEHLMVSKAAAKSSYRDENCSDETPKTEVNREHCDAKEVMRSTAAAKSSDRDENCLEEIPKTEVNREHRVAKEVMISKDAVKSSNRDGDCANGTPKTGVKRKHSVAKEVTTAKVEAKSSKIDRNSSEEIPKTGVERKHTARKELASETSELGEQLVGSKIKVWWPIDTTFYEGVVDSYDHIRKKHRILYFDGDEEKLNLKKERWELIEGAGGGQETDVIKLDSSPDTLRKKMTKTKFESAKEVKAKSFSKRSGASAGASKTKYGTKLSKKVTMTTSKGGSPASGRKSAGVGQSSGECLDNLVAVSEGTKNKRSRNDVGSVDS